jgi:hypothetical protein
VLDLGESSCYGHDHWKEVLGNDKDCGHQKKIHGHESHDHKARVLDQKSELKAVLARWRRG